MVEGDRAVQALVGVQVDPEAAAPGDGEQPVDVGQGVLGEVRGAADQVHAEVQDRLDVLVGSEGAGEGDEFDVHQVGQLVPDLHEGLGAADGLGDGAGPAVAEDVDVGADGGGAGGQQREGRGPGAVGDLVDGHRRGVLGPGGDGRDRGRRAAGRSGRR